MKTSIAVALLLTLVGCSKGGGSTSGASEPAAESTGTEAPSARRMFIECPPETRGVEMCTMDFNPVCGTHADGNPPQTYPNMCAACKDPNVVGYSTGECDSGEVEASGSAREQGHS